MNCTQGFLPNCGYLYYSVEKWLYLLDASLVFDSPIDEVPYREIEMRDILISVQEVKINSKVIQPLLRDQILLFSFPWEISFYGYTLDRTLLKIVDLKIRIPIRCEKA